MKSTPEQIRQRFDRDVERFADLETGQSATIDAPLMLDLVTRAAAVATPHAQSILDIGCGAGNYTLKLLHLLPDLNVTLIDLSQAMLDRAVDRIRPVASGTLVALPGDIRELEPGVAQYDVVLAAAVLHHLRDDVEWYSVFAKVYAALRPGGSFWITDLIEQVTPPIQALMWQRYADYLAHLRDETYRDHVFAYIEQEDTPRSLLYQIDLLRQVGFQDVDILHKNGPFAAFGAVKT